MTLTETVAVCFQENNFHGLAVSIEKGNNSHGVENKS
jgi:hypothetical protein